MSYTTIVLLALAGLGVFAYLHRAYLKSEEAKVVATLKADFDKYYAAAKKDTLDIIADVRTTAAHAETTAITAINTIEAKVKARL